MTSKKTNPDQEEKKVIRPQPDLKKLFFLLQLTLSYMVEVLGVARAGAFLLNL
jgi:hypothetical protein